MLFTSIIHSTNFLKSAYSAPTSGSEVLRGDTEEDQAQMNESPLYLIEEEGEMSMSEDKWHLLSSLSHLDICGSRKEERIPSGLECLSVHCCNDKASIRRWRQKQQLMNKMLKVKINGREV